MFILASLMFFMMFIFIILGVLTLIFWIWMFADAIKKKDTAWIILLIIALFTGFFALVFALIYYFTLYKKNPRLHKRRKK
ncbi:hypothetical protein HZA98_04250 [Candidatus Woesearchaeota archaeon]|nr:hypothetical protein [Candidatus Woesearchaeota archaeon]